MPLRLAARAMAEGVMSIVEDTPLRICVIADGRSPISRSWINHFSHAGHEMHLVSTFPCDAEGLNVASLYTAPIALARFAGGSSGGASGSAGRMSNVKRRIVSALLPTVYGWIAPFDVNRHVAGVRKHIRAVNPDVVHGMRIQYEGVLAAKVVSGLSYPLLISIWGNDLEWWASRYPLVSRLAHRVLERASALHPDCTRDLHLAEQWGWDAAKPAAVLPTNGGVRTELFHRGAADPSLCQRFGIPGNAHVVLNARGFRSYVRNDTFFQSIPRILEQHPDVIFVCVGMLGDPRAVRWCEKLGIASSVRLLPSVSRADMAGLFRAAHVAVSPSHFDGTPNTLLEAMACGAFPVSGDIPSVREWIDHGQNGLLCDPGNAQALSAAVHQALADVSFRQRAARINEAVIRNRAEYTSTMSRAQALYRSAVAAGSTS
ncbi:MAG: putative glycosyltransferase [Gemmatimonadetes bacterium]|nr:putative glycosyltransferase [Gemmatimonadota bacterium]